MKKIRISTIMNRLLGLIIITASLMSCSNRDTTEIDLSGEWKFKMDEQDIGLVEMWYADNLSEKVQLPGSMAINGKGNDPGIDIAWTGNFWKEFDDGKQWFDHESYKPYLNEDKFRFPFWLVPEKKYTGSAWYQKEISIPDNWAGQRIELFLERCHWESQVWINENFAGKQNSLGTAHRYDISSFLSPGKNRITICVDNRVKEIDVGRDAHSISDNTQSNWNGIIGQIKIIGKDAVSIDGVQLFPDIENKLVRVKAGIINTSGKEHKVRLTSKPEVPILIHHRKLNL